MSRRRLLSTLLITFALAAPIGLSLVAPSPLERSSTDPRSPLPYPCDQATTISWAFTAARDNPYVPGEYGGVNVETPFGPTNLPDLYHATEDRNAGWNHCVNQGRLRVGAAALILIGGIAGGVFLRRAE